MSPVNTECKQGDAASIRLSAAMASRSTPGIRSIGGNPGVVTGQY